VLRGQRVVLRDFEEADLERYAYWLTGAHEWRRFDGPYYPGTDPGELAQRIEELRGRIERGEWPEPRRRLVVADSDSNALIGTVAWYWISEETNWPAAGISIYDPAHWGKGLGTEALTLWIDYLFAQGPDFTRVDLRTWSGNERMVRLAEKLGFRKEACFRKARVVDGKHYDGLAYGVLREEWQARAR
jgi:putative hydrolase of HD superfamily